MLVERHGFDTVRATFRVVDVLPVSDPGFRHEMLASGFRRHVDDWFDDGRHVVSEGFGYQDRDNSTLRLHLRAGEFLAAEFSAPRLLDDSLVNLALASPGEVGELLDQVRGRAVSLIPGDAAMEFHKLNRLDYACDLAAGEAMPGVISAAMQFRLPNARKPAYFIYPGETATIRSPSFTFKAYAKGVELEGKLSRKGRGEHAGVIQLSKQRGLTRMESSNRRRGGLAYDALASGPADLAKRLEVGFPGGVVVVEGLDGIRAHVDSLDIPAQTKNSLIAFAVRYATLGRDGMIAAYSRPTFYRHQKKFLEHGLRLDDVCSYRGRVDFRPVIRELREAA